MTKKKLFLHIGTHKTGSTSLQQFLLDKVDYLGGRGIALYRGQYIEENHIELYLASMRYERDSFAKQNMRNDTTFDMGFTHRIAQRVGGFIRSCAPPCP